MPTITVMDPVTRIEGHLKVEVAIDWVRGHNEVVDAHCSGTLFRGFETILQGRAPTDAPVITERICGVCPVSHGLASTLALEKAAGKTPPANARILRNLVLGANYIQSHILHFYLLAALDYVRGPQTAPWAPAWDMDMRSDPRLANLIPHFVQSLEARRRAHEMAAIFGGRMPLPPTYIAGGFTSTPSADRITRFRAHLRWLIDFIRNVYLPDVQALAAVYDDYIGIGAGPRNLLAFGVFDLNDAGSSKLLRRGYVDNAATTVNTVNTGAITEAVTYSWYADSTGNLNPAAGRTTPVYSRYTTPAAGSGIGLTEAPRGALGHWVTISGGKLARYQVLTPTCWNASPRDDRGIAGPIEQALLGTPVMDPTRPIEALRVIHSFDPCLSCAVHVMRPDGKPVVLRTGLVK